MNDDLLRKCFNFDEADLFANRNGYLTPRQQVRLAEDEQFTKNLFLIIGYILLAAAILPYLIIWLTRAPWEFWLIWSLTWVPLWSFLGIYVIRLARPTSKSNLLKTVEGPINIVKVESYNNTTRTTSDDYELHIGGVEFDVDSELADVMMQGDTYAVYYLEGTKDIMSLELLAKRN